MARKRTLIKQLESITAQIEMLSTQLFTKDQEARMWREKYELSQLTPEVKADTEAAFKRGQNHQRGMTKAWLMAAIDSFDALE
jgi:hypothetical protein